MSTPAPQPRGVGRPRSEATHQSILAAAVHLLETESYASVSINRIAEEAGVSKQTIYRWWDAKADLVLEAYTRRVFNRIVQPELTQDPFAELELLLRGFFEVLRDPLINKGLRSLIAEAQFDTAFRAKFHAVFVSTRRSLMRQILDYGVAVGQLRADADIELALDVLYGAFWYRLLSGTTAPLDDAFARSVIDLVRPALVVPRKQKAGVPTG